jgi:hypothetical protein
MLISCANRCALNNKKQLPMKILLFNAFKFLLQRYLEMMQRRLEVSDGADALEPAPELD